MTQWNGLPDNNVSGVHRFLGRNGQKISAEWDGSIWSYRLLGREFNHSSEEMKRLHSDWTYLGMAQ